MPSLKSVLVALSLTAALALPIATMAASTTKPAKTPKTKTPKNTTPDASTVTPTPIELSGTITKTDNGDITITFKVPTNFATKVTVDGDTKALSDLKAGETCKLTFSGTSTASTIDAKSPTAPATAP